MHQSNKIHTSLVVVKFSELYMMKEGTEIGEIKFKTTLPGPQRDPLLSAEELVNCLLPLALVVYLTGQSSWEVVVLEKTAAAGSSAVEVSQAVRWNQTALMRLITGTQLQTALVRRTRFQTRS